MKYVYLFALTIALLGCQGNAPDTRSQCEKDRDTELANCAAYININPGLWALCFSTHDVKCPKVK